MAGWKPKDLKTKSFPNVQELFDKAMKRVNTFVDMDTELVGEQEPSKKQKMEDVKETVELQSMMEVIPDEEEVAIDVIPLATKPSSIGRIVGIKRLLDDLRVTAAQVRVTAAKHKLVLKIQRSFDGGSGGKVDLVPKVDDVSLVDGVFDGAFGRDREEDFVIREGVVVSSSSLVKSTKSCLGGMMVSLIFLEGLEEEACVDAMEVEEK
ncbi:hypothetical protein Tco_0093254 [Tanacetum coccineum]